MHGLDIVTVKPTMLVDFDVDCRVKRSYCMVASDPAVAIFLIPAPARPSRRGLLYVG